MQKQEKGAKVAQAPAQESTAKSQKSDFHKDMIVCRFEKVTPSEQDVKTSHLHRGLSNNMSSLRLEILENRDFSDICTNKGRTDNYFALKESKLLFGPFDRLMYMQCNTKNKTGFGKPIVVNFFASINERNRAVYNFE